MKSAASWTAYFVFSPNGVLDDSQLYTLKALALTGKRLAIICATPHQGDPAIDALLPYADALYWKDLSGYDFSAYAILANEIATKSPGASTLFMNDSVFGPFYDVYEKIEQAPWDIVAFTANRFPVHHIQSYAFYVRRVDDYFLDTVRNVLNIRYAYQRFEDVVYCQETMLAKTLSRKFSIGALWIGKPDQTDITLTMPDLLIEQGFPFIKKSLFKKHLSQRLRPILATHLSRFGHTTS